MKTSLLLLLLACTPMALSSQSLPDWLYGEWEGIGYQSNTQTEWITWLSYFPKYEAPRVEYRSLQCSGHWEIQGQEGNTLVFREIVSKNSGRCSTNDVVRVRLQMQGVLELTYAHSYAPDEVIATLTLKRRLLP